MQRQHVSSRLDKHVLLVLRGGLPTRCKLTCADNVMEPLGIPQRLLERCSDSLDFLPAVAQGRRRYWRRAGPAAGRCRRRGAWSDAAFAAAQLVLCG